MTRTFTKIDNNTVQERVEVTQTFNTDQTLTKEEIERRIAKLNAEIAILQDVLDKVLK